MVENISTANDASDVDGRARELNNKTQYIFLMYGTIPLE